MIGVGKDTDLVAVHLNSGIPVVQIVGAWSDATERKLREMVSRLMSAGHYDIIVNLAKVSGLPGPERTWLDGLSSMGSALKQRCGGLDVVGTVDQVREGVKRQARSCWRWATSEQEAVCRVKGVPNGTSTAIINATLE